MLEQKHYNQLKASAIADEIIHERGYSSVAPASIHDWRQCAGNLHSDKRLKQVLVQGAWSAPLFRLGEQPEHTWLLRPDQPRKDKKGKPIKYEYPQGVSNVFDVLPRHRALVGNPQVPVIITEGMKKADSITSAYDMAALVINLNGVWGFRCTSASGGKVPSGDIAEIAWNNREVRFYFDSDIVRIPQVLQAMQQLAAILTARGAGLIRVLTLPDPATGKMGVDDYFASGRGVDELESHLTTLTSAQQAVRMPLFKHPDTGKELFLPMGYKVAHHCLYKDGFGQRDDRLLYPGMLYVYGVGSDMTTHEKTLTVRFHHSGATGQVIAPQKELAGASGCRDALASQGGICHAGNDKALSEYLLLFAAENLDALPQHEHSDTLGVVEDGLVLPGGNIGFSRDVSYIGQPVQIGSDADAYPNVLREVMEWHDAWAFWLVFGLVLASPAITRAKLRRNPVIYVAGGSGSGKTTIAQFSNGLWGDPTRKPLLIEAGRTTTAGIQQTLRFLNGLSLFIDEAHTAASMERLQLACYDFANGQLYTKGGRDGRALGGEPVGGSLLLAGEAVPEFKNAGAVLRTFWVNGSNPPLGAGTIGLSGTQQHALGQQRANMLERAWTAGSGLFGKAVYERIWSDWQGFQDDYEAIAEDQALEPLRAWRVPLAIGAAALNVAFQVVGYAPGDEFGVQLLDSWSNMLTEGHDERDPARDAWEALVLLLAQAENGVHDVWEIKLLRNEPVAYRLPTENIWRVPTGTPQFRDRIGGSAVQMYGKTWLTRGWIQPHQGKPSGVKKVAGNVSMRVICPLEGALDDW
jgi:hypothetical protein